MTDGARTNRRLDDGDARQKEGLRGSCRLAAALLALARRWLVHLTRANEAHPSIKMVLDFQQVVFSFAQKLLGPDTTKGSFG